jgi:hypothetical protein
VLKENNSKEKSTKLTMLRKVYTKIMLAESNQRKIVNGKETIWITPNHDKIIIQRNYKELEWL